MTNLTPTTELKFAPLPVSDEAWYSLSFSATDEDGYMWGSQEEVKKYQDLMGEYHYGITNSPTLNLVTEPEILAGLEIYERADRILLADGIEALQELIDNEANNPHN